MLIRLLEDLRFVIGTFFGVISLILLSVGFFGHAVNPGEINLNLLAGGVMLLFSIVMVTLTFVGNAAKAGTATAAGATATTTTDQR